MTAFPLQRINGTEKNLHGMQRQNMGFRTLDVFSLRGRALV